MFTTKQITNFYFKIEIKVLNAGRNIIKSNIIKVNNAAQEKILLL